MAVAMVVAMAMARAKGLVAAGVFLCNHSFPGTFQNPSAPRQCHLAASSCACSYILLNQIAGQVSTCKSCISTKQRRQHGKPSRNPERVREWCSWAKMKRKRQVERNRKGKERRRNSCTNNSRVVDGRYATQYRTLPLISAFKFLFLLS